MAYTYSDLSLFACDEFGNRLVGQEVPVFTAVTGGVEVTALQDLDGDALPGRVTSNDKGLWQWQELSESWPTLYIQPPVAPGEPVKRYPVTAIEAVDGVGAAILASADAVAAAGTAITASAAAIVAASGAETRSLEALDSAAAAETVAAEARQIAAGSGAANVVTFGADNTGVSDAGPAFQAAIDSVADAGGGQVSIPPGLYIIDTIVHLRSDITITGYAATLTKTTAGSPYSVFASVSGAGTGYGSGARNVTIRGLHFLGDYASGQYINAFSLHHAQNVLVEDCRFEQCHGEGSHLFDINGSDSITISRCVFLGCDTTYTLGVEAVQVDVSSWGAMSYKATGEVYDGLFSRRVTVRSCQFLPLTVGATTYPCSFAFGGHSQVEGHSFDDMAFIDNLVIDPPTGEVPGDGDITHDGESRTGIVHMPGAKNLTVRGNTFRMTAARTCTVVNVQSVIKGTVASTFNPNSTTGSPTGTWAAPVIAQDVRVEQNVIEGFKPTTTLGCELIYIRGIETVGLAARILVSNNTITNAYDAASAQNKSPIYLWFVDGAVVAGNTVKTALRYLYVRTSRKVSVVGGSVDDTFATVLFIGGTCTLVTVNGLIATLTRGAITIDTGSSDVTISGCSIIVDPAATGNAARGIVITGSVAAVARFAVTGNTITKTGTAATDGIALGSAVSNGVITTNVITGYTTKISGTGTNVTITGNV